MPDKFASLQIAAGITPAAASAEGGDQPAEDGEEGVSKFCMHAFPFRLSQAPWLCTVK